MEWGRGGHCTTPTCAHGVLCTLKACVCASGWEPLHVPRGVQIGEGGTLHPKGGVRGFFGGGTHPRQRFLLMEGTLRLQGRLTGAVGEEGASYGGTTGVLGGGGGHRDSRPHSPQFGW